MLGYFERTEPLIEQVACIEANVGYLGWGDELGNLNAWTDWATGRWKRLEASIEELDGEADDGASRYRTVSGSLLASKGRHETAEVRLREDMERAMEAGRLPEILGSSASLARCLLSQGKPVESVEVTTRSLELLRSKGIWVWSTDLVPVAIDALLTVGRTGEAHRVEEEMAASLAGRDAPAAGGALTWCRGALAEAAGDHALAAEHFGQADAVWSRLPRPYDAARARERQGRAVLNVTEQADLGTDLLVGALSDYSDLGATDDVARVKELLRSHRIDVPYPWRGGRYSYGKDLSPREMSVARRAALGQTNLEIAKDLFLSPKTVERHMAKAMRKLGVRRRAALAAALVPTNTGDD
jgi:DNA-binding CsgD family transcriptional regulator